MRNNESTLYKHDRFETNLLLSWGLIAMANSIFFVHLMQNKVQLK